MAASVLLNFSNGIVFPPADPLIGLVRAGERLLAYERLSVASFEGADPERKKQIRRNVGELRNILENRCLSNEDDGERIRLIILLDFKPWHFLKPDYAVDSFDSSFPLLKLEYIKAEIEDVYGEDNPLLSRFDYVVIYIDDNPCSERSKRYWLAAYHGFCRMGGSVDWLSKDHLKLNKDRNDTLKKMGNHDAALPLSDNNVQAVYNEFLAKLENAQKCIKNYLSKIGKDRAFEDLAKKLCDVETVGDFQHYDYDHFFEELVRETAGIGSKRFRDTTFFMVPLRQSVASQHCKDSIVLKSLIQLLCTIDEEQFKIQFRPVGSNDFHKLFLMSDTEEVFINTELLLQYYQDIMSQGKQLGGPKWADSEGELTGMCWDSSKEVKYNIYSPCDANAEGALKAQNEAVNLKGNEKVKSFKNKRRVPFFFGASAGDRAWYRELMDSFKECLTFEEVNKRPEFEEHKRPADQELPKIIETVNYGELGKRIENMPKIEIESTVNYEAYIANRKKDIDQLAVKGELMKKRLVKLGIRSRFIWISVLSGIAFLLCFSFHSIYVKDNTFVILILSALAAFITTVLLSAFIARWILKEKILDIYREIDSLFDDMQNLARQHLKSVNDLAAKMNKADADRKTLTEMTSKYNDWAKHNKKVEIWVSHTRAMKLLLDDTLRYLGLDRQGREAGKFSLDDSILDMKPSLATQIWSKDEYKNMAPKLIVTNQNRENTINNASSFVSQFKFDIEQL